MTYKNAKTILFAGIIAAMILPFSGMDFAEAKSSNTNYDKLSSQIDKEIDKFVKKSEKFSDNPEKLAKLKEKFADKQAKLIEKYQKKMSKSLDTLLGQDFTNLSTDERNEMVSLIINEKFKAPMQEKFVAEMLADEGISVLGYDLLPSAFAACSTQPDVTQFKQVTIDIAVGVVGDNPLQTVVRNDMSSCLREYTLTFKDEDHPNPIIDVAYDAYRLVKFETVKDIEKFYVSNGDIWFLDTGSNSQTFNVPWPTHYLDVNSFSSSVYVSNTWNHLMDTTNTNPSYSITTWYK